MLLGAYMVKSMGLAEVTTLEKNMKLSLKDMIEAGIHLGHKKRFCNTDMLPYIYGLRYGIHIHDLNQTKAQLEVTMKRVTQLIANGGSVLFVGTKVAAHELVEDTAKKLDMPFVVSRWLGGLLTNYTTVKKSVKKLEDLEARIESGEVQRLSKKEMLMELKKYEKLDYNIGGIRKMKGLPDALFVIDVKHEHTAIAEANKLGIPVIGIVDTNSSPHGIDYVIPGNDDSSASIQYYLDCIANAIEEGKKKITVPQKQKTVVSKKTSEKTVEAKTKDKASTNEKPAKKTAEKKKASDKDTTTADTKPAKKTTTKKADAPKEKSTKKTASVKTSKEDSVQKKTTKKVDTETKEKKPAAKSKKKDEDK